MAASSAHALVVEDNPDTAFLMEQILDSICDVTLAPDGEKALEEARRASYDLVLMDINLGKGPTGTDVLRALRQMPAYRDVPIAAVTAYALPGDSQRFLSLGFDAYLGKPFTADELLQLSSDLLAR